MSFFRRGSDDEREARSRAQTEQAASLDALSQGALPLRAQQRLGEIGKAASGFFTSDLSVDEFVLVHALGLRPISQVMGSSIYQIAPRIPDAQQVPNGCELTEMTQALSHARELAMNRMEEEADELGADGVVGVRLTVNLGVNPQRLQWELYREWQDWARRAGFPSSSTLLQAGWQGWQARRRGPSPVRRSPRSTRLRAARS